MAASDKQSEKEKEWEKIEIPELVGYGSHLIYNQNFLLLNKKWS